MTAAATKYWKPMPKFRVKRAYGFYRVGDVIETSGLMRDAMVQGGYIEPVREQREAAVVPQAENALEPQSRAKRRRATPPQPETGTA